MNLLLLRILDFLKGHKLVSAIGGGAVLLFLFGLLGIGNPQQDEPMKFTASKSSVSTSTANISSGSSLSKNKVKEIIIDVSGAVVKPGVYALKSDARVKDAILAAGGMSDNADRLKVAQTINLAAPLTDGGKLYIPAVGEQMTGSGGVSGIGSDGTSVGSSTGIININSANETELDALPGVGKVTADKIIANRPYQTVAELVDKKVVGSSEFNKIKDKVSTF
jgi:competence protein ComEA